MPAIANTLIVDNTFTIDNNTIDVSQSDLTFSIDASYIVDVSGTGALRIPVGTTNERPVLAGNRSDYIGCIRYNTSEDSSGAEIYDKNLQWVPLGSGGGGGGGGGGGINEDIQTVDFELDFDNKDKGFLNIYTKAPKYKTVSFLENVDILSGDITSYIISNDGSSNNKIKLTFGEPVEPLWIKGGGTTKMAHSVDGINWNNVSVTNAPLTSSKTILWNGFIWVAGGTGTSYSIAWSEDGTNWTGASHSMTTVNKVEWNGSKWVAVGAPKSISDTETNGITIQYSDDGKTWNDVANSTNNFRNHGNTVVWIDYASIWIAGGDGSNNQIAISTDGVSWANKEGGMGTTGNKYCMNIGWNDNIIIAGGGHYANEIAYSQDNGSTWALVPNINLQAVNSQPIWNGNMWTAGAAGFSNELQLVYSDDGINWTATYSGFTNHGYTTSWNGDRWVAGGVSSSIATSADGSTWTGGFGTGIFSNCYYIEWTGKYFIAMSGSGSNDMAYSYDGINWTGSGSFNTSYQDAFAFNTARANQITFDSNGDPTVTIHKPLTNVSTLEFVLEYENQPAVSNVNVTIQVPVSGSGGGGGDIGNFVFDGSMIYVPSDSMNIKAPGDNIYITTGTDKMIFFDSTAVKLPSGSTTARPIIDVSSEYVGTIRYNSETSQYEGFGNEYEWKTIGGGNTATEQGVTTTTFENDLVIEGKLTATEEISAPLISTTSDSRYKQNINTITNALSKINEMRGVYYELMTEPNIRRIGVIAQETEKIFPEVISNDKNDYKSVSYGNLVGALIESIKELSVKNTQLEKTVNNLKGRIENLEQKL